MRMLDVSDPTHPPQASDILQIRMRRWVRSLEPVGNRNVIAIGDAPSDEDRQALQDRLREIGGCLVKATHLSIVEAIFRMQQTGLAVQGNATIEAYAEDLCDLPAFALLKSCRDFRLGKAGGHRFLPTVAQLRELAEQYAQPLYQEQRQIRDVLEAEIVAVQVEPERRKAAAEMAREMTLRMQIDAHNAERERMGLPPEPEPETPEQILARVARFSEKRLTQEHLDAYAPSLPKTFAKLNARPKTKKRPAGPGRPRRVKMN